MLYQIGKVHRPEISPLAEFYARKTGWIPVDISEAWKTKREEGSRFLAGALFIETYVTQRRLSV